MSRSENIFLKSMTGYGQAVVENPKGSFSVEIQGTNRRYLETNISLPRSFNRFEPAIKRQIDTSVGRGHINLSLVWKRVDDSSLDVSANIGLGRALKKAYLNLAEELDVKSELTLQDFIREEGIIHIVDKAEQDDALLKMISQSVEKALAQFNAMRLVEGRYLGDDLLRRVQLLESFIAAIEKEKENVLARAVEKLKGRL